MDERTTDTDPHNGQNAGNQNDEVQGDPIGDVQIEDAVVDAAGGDAEQVADWRARARQRARQGAERLRDTADRTTTRLGTGVGRASEAFGDSRGKVKAVARWLRDKEPEEMLEDARAVIRKHPAKAMLMAAGAGVMLTRGRMIMRVAKVGSMAVTARRALEYKKQLDERRRKRRGEDREP